MGLLISKKGSIFNQGCCNSSLDFDLRVIRLANIWRFGYNFSGFLSISVRDDEFCCVNIKDLPLGFTISNKNGSFEVLRVFVKLGLGIANGFSLELIKIEDSAR